MNSNSRKTQLMEYIKMLSSEAVNLLLTIVLGMIDVENTVVSACPYCAGKHIVHNGKTCGKQRFLCRSCERTFVTTTHTILSMSHSPASIWKEVVADTLMGRSIDYTAERIGLSHPCVFHMRHKILLGFDKLIEADPVILTQVAELDETVVLECFKGKKLPPEISRPARKHGAKAQKRGISSEYICINTGVEREGGAIAKATNRAKPDCCELAQVYTGRIGTGSLVICDGLKSYKALKDMADCTIKDIHTICEGEEGFYHLNTVNHFHRFIKEQYHIYRGVATKYLNRYTALFALVWRQGETALADVCPKLFVPSTTNYHYSIRDVKMEKLLLI